MFRTLRTRLIVAFASVTVVALAVALVGFLYLIRDREINAARERVGQLVNPVAWQVQAMGQSGATESQISDYLNERAKALQVRFLLLDDNARVLDDSGGRLAGDIIDLSKKSDLRFSRTGPAGFAFVSHTVSGNQQVLFQPSPFLPPTLITVPNVTQTKYQILMAVPEQDLTGVWHELATRILIAASAGLLLTVILSVLISRSIALPLARMTRASEEMSRGNYQQRIESNRKDEVGRLAVAFNSMAEQVNHSDQMMRDLLANVAHELKTPLTSIQGFSQALSDGLMTSPEEHDRAVRIISEEAERMRQLVEDLLYLSQIESGQVRMELGPIDVGSLLYNSLERVYRRAREAGVEAQLIVADSLPLVTGDERRLEQVVTNLLDNAVRYTPRDGLIRLKAEVAGSFIQVAVHNTGSYIPPEDLKRVFERFYRVERARTGRNGGLGLAIVSEIVAAHGGRVDVSSSVTDGTEFRFTLPISERPPETTRRTADVDGTGRQKGAISSR